MGEGQGCRERGQVVGRGAGVQEAGQGGWNQDGSPESTDVPVCTQDARLAQTAECR